MTGGNKMSRRDWFRLRRSSDTSIEVTLSDLPREPQVATNHSMGEAPNGLRPIAHPENHDGMNLSELPPMREALLSEEQVRQLFSDIEALASDVLLMQRSPRSQRTTVSKATTAEQLGTAQNALLSGSIPRVQVRYQWQAANWIDTLELRENGVRLIRITHAPYVFDSRRPTKS